MTFGVAYYPEHVSLVELSVDLERIRDIGFSYIRIGDFAWSVIEPAAGDFDWEIFDATFSRAAELGLGIVLCTPTAAPPVWLTRQHPEVLPVDIHGHRAIHGARQHRCFNVPAYRDASNRVVEALATRYGDATALSGWQIDNELGGEHKRCYCEFCGAAFRNRLKAEFGSIDELNLRWGTRFWSQRYLDWEDIPIPRRIHLDMMLKHHPSLTLEYARFCSDSIVSFAEEQASILRRHTPEGVPITTNTDSFHWGDSLDLGRLYAQLDEVSIDLYTDDTNELAFYGAVARGIKVRGFQLGELGVNVPNLEATVRTPAIAGCESICFFKYHPFRWGQEQSLRAVRTSCDRPSSAQRRIEAIIADPRLQTSPETKIPETGRRVALLYDFESSWVFEESSWSDNWEERTRYPRYLMEVIFRSLRECGHDPEIRFARNSSDLTSFDLVAAPWLVIHRADVEEILAACLDRGATVVSTIDLFTRDRDNVIQHRVPAIYRRCFGAGCDDFFHLADAPAPRSRTPITSKTGSGSLFLLPGDATACEWSQLFSDSSDA